MSRFYITTAIPYANGAPAYRPRLRAHRHRRDPALQAARRLRHACSSPAWTSTARRCSRRRRAKASPRRRSPTGVAAQFEAMGDAAERARRRHRAHHASRATRAPRRRSGGAWTPNGDIYLSKYSGWYSVRDEAYFDESELTLGPDGRKLAPSGAPVEWVEEESYFFRLSAYAERLLAHYEAHPDFVTPEKYRNEIVAFVKRGLTDLSISRTDLRLGRAGARRSEARHVRLGRRADQLPDRDRLSRRAARAKASGRLTPM